MDAGKTSTSKRAWCEKKNKTSSNSGSVGSLDSVKQLEDMYAKLCRSNNEIEETLEKEVFRTVRILTIGRSGVGKTTLIRLIIGEDGPQSIAEGVAGEQDINKEWRPAAMEGLPHLIIHDSNGMDVMGKERVDTIREFLDRHQRSEDFSEHVHLVWYVISAGDTRFVMDGHVMRLVSGYGIPVLLIMTFADWECAVEQNVTEANLNRLLDGVIHDKEEVKKRMVRVGNWVKKGAHNDLLVEKLDVQGLKLVSKRTSELMNKKLRYTWAASQAVDMDYKLDVSAHFIARYGMMAIYSSVAGVIPLLDSAKLSILFFRIFKILCKIWRVPRPLEVALTKNLLLKEGTDSILRSILRDLVTSLGLLTTVGLSVATAGAALIPSTVVVLATSGLLNFRSAPMAVKTFSLLVLGTILYSKASQAVGKQIWNPNITAEEWMKHCEDFAHDSHYQNMIKAFVRKDNSIQDTMMRKKKVKGIIKSQIVELNGKLLKARPNSLNSLLRSTLEEENDHNKLDADQNVDVEESSSSTADEDDLSR